MCDVRTAHLGSFKVEADGGNSGVNGHCECYAPTQRLTHIELAVEAGREGERATGYSHREAGDLEGRGYAAAFEVQGRRIPIGATESNRLLTVVGESEGHPDPCHVLIRRKPRDREDLGHCVSEGPVGMTGVSAFQLRRGVGPDAAEGDLDAWTIF